MTREQKIKKAYKKLKNYRAVGRRFRTPFWKIYTIVKSDPINHKILTSAKRKLLGLPSDKCKGLGGRDWIRELVRIRDKRTCQKCDKKWKGGERRLDVHHLDEDRDGIGNIKGSVKYDRENMKRLITLCHKCHLNLPRSKKRMKEGRKKSINNLSTPSSLLPYTTSARIEHIITRTNTK